MNPQSAGEAGASRGLAMVLAAAGAMGTLGPVAGVAYAEGMGSATFSALRAATGASILGVLVLSGLQPRTRLVALPRRQKMVLAMAIATNGIMNLALFLAFGAMAVGLVMAVYYTYPVLVAVVDAWLGRSVLTPRRLLALALAAGGMAVLVLTRLDPGAHATALGLGLAGVAAACHAIYLLAVRGGFDDVPSAQATSLVLLGGIAISGVGAICLGELALVADWSASPAAWLAVATAGTVGALPKVWVIGGTRRIGSTRAALAMMVEPLVAVIVAAILLGQWLRPIELLAGAAILLATTLVQTAPTHGSRVAAPRPVIGEPVTEPRGAAPGGRESS